jgi:hypothetical protein
MDTFIHGDNQRRSDVFLTHGTGVLVAGLLVYINRSLVGWQLILLFALMWDVVGGVVSNCTASTNQWYMRQSIQTRFVFIAIHIIQPMLLIWILDGTNWLFAVVLYAYMMICAGIVLITTQSELQRPLAAVFYIIGMTLITFSFSLSITLQLFAYLYLFKLIVCFSVDHYGARKGTNA